MPAGLSPQPSAAVAAASLVVPAARCHRRHAPSLVAAHMPSPHGDSAVTPAPWYPPNCPTHAVALDVSVDELRLDGTLGQPRTATGIQPSPQAQQPPQPQRHTDTQQQPRTATTTQSHNHSHAVSDMVACGCAWPAAQQATVPHAPDVPKIEHGRDTARGTCKQEPGATPRHGIHVAGGASRLRQHCDLVAATDIEHLDGTAF